MYLKIKLDTSHMGSNGTCTCNEVDATSRVIRFSCKIDNEMLLLVKYHRLCFFNTYKH